jgi:hypothetical protein
MKIELSERLNVLQMTFVVLLLFVGVALADLKLRGVITHSILIANKKQQSLNF